MKVQQKGRGNRKKKRRENEKQKKGRKNGKQKFVRGKNS